MLFQRILTITIVLLLLIADVPGLPVDEKSEEDFPAEPDKEIAEDDEERPEIEEPPPEKDDEGSPPPEIFGRQRPDLDPGFGVFNRPYSEDEENGFDFDGHSGPDYEMPNELDKSGEDDVDYGMPAGESDSDHQPFPFRGSFFFDGPFFNMRQVGRYFQQLEKALQEVYEATVSKALNSNDSFANSTEEVVEMGGRKYKVQKTIIRGGNRNNSVFIEAISTRPLRNDTKITGSRRSTDSGEK